MCADEYILFFYLTEKIREFFADVYEVANMNFGSFVSDILIIFERHKNFNLTTVTFLWRSEKYTLKESQVQYDSLKITSIEMWRFLHSHPFLKGCQS